LPKRPTGAAARLSAAMPILPRAYKISARTFAEADGSSSTRLARPIRPGIIDSNRASRGSFEIEIRSAEPIP
jgi:hypothetical protein